MPVADMSSVHYERDRDYSHEEWFWNFSEWVVSCNAIRVENSVYIFSRHFTIFTLKRILVSEKDFGASR